MLESFRSLRKFFHRHCSGIGQKPTNRGDAEGAEKRILNQEILRTLRTLCLCGEFSFFPPFPFFAVKFIFDCRIKTLGGVVAFFCAFGCASAFAHFPIPPKKGEIGRRVVDKPVKDFILVDQTGKKFQLAGARGKILAITFVYTKCPDVCPLFTAKFASIQRALAQEMKQQKKPADYLLLTITTDPEYDTPKQLRSYADLFKPDYARWSFLTGTRDKLAGVWKDFGVSVHKGADGHVQHTALTSVLDRKGVRRVDYYGDKWQEKELLQDLLSLAARDQPAN